MIKVKTIASGSKGNCCLIQSNDTNILIDIGISFKRVKASLDKENLTIKDIDAILITHEHDDHVKGLQVLLNKEQINVHIPSKTREYFISYKNVHTLIDLEREFVIKDLNIKTIKTSHDSMDSAAFIIKSGTSSLVYITDTGYINHKYLEDLKNHNLYVIESNHDEELLMNGTRPHHLKQRILSDKGHLSNRSMANYLKKMMSEKTSHIILAHLSEDNNEETLVIETIKEVLGEDCIQTRKFIIAKQNEESELITI